MTKLNWDRERREKISTQAELSVYIRKLETQKRTAHSRLSEAGLIMKVEDLKNLLKELAIKHENFRALPAGTHLLDRLKGELDLMKMYIKTAKACVVILENDSQGKYGILTNNCMRTLDTISEFLEACKQK
jgi:hypothetical protein